VGVGRARPFAGVILYGSGALGCPLPGKRAPNARNGPPMEVHGVPNGPPMKRDRVPGGPPMKRLKPPGRKKFDTGTHCRSI
jgi:hypothetical protein